MMIHYLFCLWVARKRFPPGDFDQSKLSLRRKLRGHLGTEMRKDAASRLNSAREEAFEAGWDCPPMFMGIVTCSDCPSAPFCFGGGQADGE